ncbi:hypothetical protein Tco_0663472 [Tanacetum coccineum]
MSILLCSLTYHLLAQAPVITNITWSLSLNWFSNNVDIWHRSHESLSWRKSELVVGGWKLALKPLKEISNLSHSGHQSVHSETFAVAVEIGVEGDEKAGADVARKAFEMSIDSEIKVRVLDDPVLL